MAILNGMNFSTKDHDNDQYSGNCALHSGPALPRGASIMPK